MATLTAEQIEQKKQRLKQLTEQINAIVNELQEAGAWPLDEDELEQATGGLSSNPSPVGLGREKYVRNGC
ncbi:MAG: hypothetical protein IKM78_02195 [Prevotella sp.]|nr:hypothetical protein [Prevotella sp.]